MYGEAAALYSCFIKESLFKIYQNRKCHTYWCKRGKYHDTWPMAPYITWHALGKCGLHLKLIPPMHDSCEQHLKSWHRLTHYTWNPSSDPKSCLLSLFNQCQAIRNQCFSVLAEAHIGYGSHKKESFFKLSTIHYNIEKKFQMLKKYKQSLEMLRRLCFHRFDMLHL